MYNFVKEYESVPYAAAAHLKLGPIQIRHHICYRTCIVVPVTDITCRSPLHFFNLKFLLLWVGPKWCLQYSNFDWTKALNLHQRPLQCTFKYTISKSKYGKVERERENNLKWDKHINTMTAKANQSLGFIKRNLKVHSPTIKENAFKVWMHFLIVYLKVHCSGLWCKFDAGTITCIRVIWVSMYKKIRCQLV